MTAAYVPQLVRLSICFETQATLREVAPYLFRFTQLRTLGLITVDLDGIDTLNHWPKPLFRLDRLELSLGSEEDDQSSLELDGFSWFTDSSRDSLRHLTLYMPSPEIVSKLAQWGTNLRSLAIELDFDPVRESQEELLSRAGDVIRLGRRTGLEMLELCIRVEKHPESDDARATVGDQVQVLAEEVNNERGREVVRVIVN